MERGVKKLFGWDPCKDDIEPADFTSLSERSTLFRLNIYTKFL